MFIQAALFKQDSKVLQDRRKTSWDSRCLLELFDGLDCTENTLERRCEKNFLVQDLINVLVESWLQFLRLHRIGQMLAIVDTVGDRDRLLPEGWLGLPF